MSLFGVISQTPVRVRTFAASGVGWGIDVGGPEDRWTTSAHRGGGGSVAVYDRAREWFVSDDAKNHGGHDRAVSRGDLVVAALTSRDEKATLARSTPWIFVYEGTIAGGEALSAALDPGWVVSPGLSRRPGTLIFAHFITYLADVGSNMTAHAAMAKATSDLRRARSLGSAAFICSNGRNLYAYASGRPLRVSNVVDAILVGSPDVTPAAGVATDLPDASLIALQKRPQLGWAILST